MKIININIGIVDDMEYAAKVVKSFIRSSVYSKGQDINIYTYTSSQDVMISATQIKFDILFMDIDLGDHISGINIAYKIKEIYPDCLIIYMSGYNHPLNKYLHALLFLSFYYPLKSSFSNEARRILLYRAVSMCL